ncbi:MAG: pinensin family lanthipeptide [Bacteroidota bacterium]
MKKKLNLDQLKVNSFVTDLSKNTEKTVKGGVQYWSDVACDSAEDCGLLSWPGGCNKPTVYGPHCGYSDGRCDIPDTNPPKTAWCF